MPVTNVRSKWSSGSLVFETASGTELMTIATTGVNIPTFTIDSLLTITATAATFAATCFPVLPITDTDGTVEGSIWYDASEDKLKFKTAAGVETITSS